MLQNTSYRVLDIADIATMRDPNREVYTMLYGKTVTKDQKPRRDKIHVAVLV
jgi:hypothetical protein